MTAINLLEVDVILQLHVLGMDANALHAPSLIRNSDIHLPIKAAKAAEGRIDAEELKNQPTVFRLKDKWARTCSDGSLLP